MRKLVGFTATSLIVALVASSVASGDSLIVRERFDTAVSAYGGRLVWNSYSARTRAFYLKTWFRGRVNTVPIAPRRVPFDVELGPNAAGHTAAVYSRCRTEPEGGGQPSIRPEYETGVGCVIYEYDFASRREVRLQGPNARATDNFLPSIWRGRIAFVREYTQRRGVQAILPHILVGPANGSAPMRELPGGPRGVYTDLDIGGRRLPQRDRFDGGPGPVALDVGPTGLAFAWGLRPKDCHPGDPPLDLPAQMSEVWIDRSDGGQHLIDQGCRPSVIDQTAFFDGPSFSGASVFYYQQRNNENDQTASHFRYYDTRTGRYFDVQAPPGSLWVARDGGTTYYTYEAKSAGPRPSDLPVVNVMSSTTLAFQPSAPSPH